MEVESFMSGEAVGREGWGGKPAVTHLLLSVHATRRYRRQRQYSTRCSRRSTWKFH